MPPLRILSGMRVTDEQSHIANTPGIRAAAGSGRRNAKYQNQEGPVPAILANFRANYMDGRANGRAGRALHFRCLALEPGEKGGVGKIGRSEIVPRQQLVVSRRQSRKAKCSLCTAEQRAKAPAFRPLALTPLPHPRPTCRLCRTPCLRFVLHRSQQLFPAEIRSSTELKRRERLGPPYWIEAT